MAKTGMTKTWISTDLYCNTTSGRIKLSEGHCRMCQRPSWVRPLTRHHLVPLHWFLRGSGIRHRAIRNANANIVPLCRVCHDLIEHGDDHARVMLRRLLTQMEVAFVVKMRGIEWLDRIYPLDLPAGDGHLRQGRGDGDRGRVAV